MSAEKIGPLDRDTVLVLLITAVSSGVILTLSGIIMLANSWTTMAEADVPHVEIGPAHGDDHGGGH